MAEPKLSEKDRLQKLSDLESKYQKANTEYQSAKKTYDALHDEYVKHTVYDESDHKRYPTKDMPAGLIERHNEAKEVYDAAANTKGEVGRFCAQEAQAYLKEGEAENYGFSEYGDGKLRQVNYKDSNPRSSAKKQKGALKSSNKEPDNAPEQQEAEGDEVEQMMAFLAGADARQKAREEAAKKKRQKRNQEKVKKKKEEQEQQKPKKEEETEQQQLAEQKLQELTERQQIERQELAEKQLLEQQQLAADASLEVRQDLTQRQLAQQQELAEKHQAEQQALEKEISNAPEPKPEPEPEPEPEVKVEEELTTEEKLELEQPKGDPNTPLEISPDDAKRASDPTLKKIEEELANSQGTEQIQDETGPERAYMGEDYDAQERRRLEQDGFEMEPLEASDSTLSSIPEPEPASIASNTGVEMTSLADGGEFDVAQKAQPGVGLESAPPMDLDPRMLNPGVVGMSPD